MIDMEDLPRLESLSPIRDIEDDFHRHTLGPGMTIIPTNLSETLNNGNPSTMSVNNISRKTIDQLISNIGKNINSVGNDVGKEGMLIGGGLRYISQMRQYGEITLKRKKTIEEIRTSSWKQSVD